MVPSAALDAYTEMIGFPARVLGSAGLIFLADRKVQEGQDLAANQQEIARLRADLEARVEQYNTKIADAKWKGMMPGLVTARDLTKWNSQVRWPWGEVSQTPPASQPRRASQPARTWRDAASADRQSNQNVARWVTVPGLGPSGRAMALKPASLASSWSEADPNAPTLHFDFAAQPGNAELLIDFLPTFRIFPGMKSRVAVSVDDQSPIVVDVPGSGGSEDENGRVRANAVQDNYARARVPLPGLTPGRHVLTIRAVDPGIVIDQLSLP
jgi:hypothetical protein